jgi:hypothetical protein
MRSSKREEVHLYFQLSLLQPLLTVALALLKEQQKILRKGVVFS